MTETSADILYHYSFEGISERLTILAPGKVQARQALSEMIQGNPKYSLECIVQETTSRPLAGITCILIKNEPHVWVGRKVHPSGWLKKTEYDAAIKGKPTP